MKRKTKYKIDFRTDSQKERDNQRFIIMKRVNEIEKHNDVPSLNALMKVVSEELGFSRTFVYNTIKRARKNNTQC